MCQSSRGRWQKYNTKSKMLIRGVYEGVTEDHIEDYINSAVPYKKFVVTPESFRRIKEVLENNGINMYEEYFLLFDECERAIQDVNYRKNVILPMLDFFKFTNKAFVSATPIMPSDPRFKRHGFKIMKIDPTFDYKQDLQLLVTDNVLFSLQQYLKANPRDKYFIFVKSTESIARIIRSLGILKESAVFCAKDSKEKLKANDFIHVSVTLTEFQKYNFFTSRFFSAVDIEYEGDPTVVVLSDIISMDHAIVDPASEVIQISGRFRKTLRDMVHITNLNPLLHSLTKEEVLNEIRDSHMVYKEIKKFYNGCTTTSGKATLKQMLERVDYARYVDWSGERNYYMVDNTIQEEKVNGYYQSIENLKVAYEFNKHFNLEVVNQNHELTDTDTLKATRAKRLKSVYEVIMPKIKEIFTPGKYTVYEQYFKIGYLRIEYPKVVADFERVGYEEAKRLDFDPRAIKKVIKRLNNQDVEEHFGLIKYIQEHFREHKQYSSEEIAKILQEGLEQLNLLTLVAGVRLLKKFCKVSRVTIQSRTKTRKEIKGYVIDKLPKR
jgi:hypothetical protein